jgi:preprotein translocase SecE subunit
MTTNQDQGRLARMFAFWCAVFLLIFGCHFIFQQLYVHVPALAKNFGSNAGVGGLRIPIVNVGVNGAFVIAMALFVGGFLWISRWQNRPQVATFLADTETELRNVTWPSWNEVVNSSTVVVACVLILMAFLAVVDLLLARVFGRLFLS